MANYIKCYPQNHINYTVNHTSTTDCAFQVLQLNHQKLHLITSDQTPSCLTITSTESQATWVDINASSLLSLLQRSQPPFLYPHHPAAVRQMKTSSSWWKKSLVSFPTGEVNSIVGWLPRRHLNIYNNSQCSWCAGLCDRAETLHYKCRKSQGPIFTKLSVYAPQSCSACKCPCTWDVWVSRATRDLAAVQ